MLRPNRRCLDGGYLVGGRHVVPEDQSQAYADERTEIVGCNRLRCLRCDELVRQHAGGSARRYLCGCAGWLETSLRPTSVLCAEGKFDDAQLPWRCAGHPATTRDVVAVS